MTKSLASTERTERVLMVGKSQIKWKGRMVRKHEGQTGRLEL